jgi:5-methylcytosine-specific restriction protein A
MDLSKYNGKHNPLYKTAVSNPVDVIDKLEHMKVYNSKQWKRMRLLKLSEEPMCIMCKKNNVIKEATVVDHCITFTDMNDEVAFNYDNYYSLCDVCHGKLTQLEKHNRVRWKQMYDVNPCVETIQRVAEEKYRVRSEVSSDGYYIDI